MFDPVSVVGFIGTTAGLISFVANTARVLHERKTEWQECEELLTWYKIQYDTAHVQLKCWRNIWCDKDCPRSDSAYSYFWGMEGFKDVRERIDRIRIEDENIRKLLYCEGVDVSNLPRASLKEWRHHLENNVNCRSSQHQPGKWMSLFCFALYKHSDIKTRIDRLKERVADLETFSKLTFWMLQGQEDTSSQVFPEELDRLYRVRRAMKHFERYLLTWGNQCALVLGKPVLTDGLISLEEDHVLTLEFLIETKLPGAKDKIVDLVLIDCPLTDSESESGNLKNLEDMTTISTDPLKPAFQAMKAFLKRTIMEDELRKASTLLRAQVASELVDSLILCYGTPCIRSLCTCGVRATHLADKARFWTFRDVHCSDYCHGEPLRDRGFVLLAVALAELAISTPINILQPTPNEFKFQLNGAEGPKELKLAELFREVSLRSCRPYRKAVEYCLKIDGKLRNREIRPEDYPLCLKSISEP
jgi:hypothetical protein